MNDFQDKTLTCRDCGNTFTFSADEQRWFNEKGFTNEPTRCPSCRAKRKAERGSGGGGGFHGGGNYRGGGGHSGPRQMFPAVCAECGRDTEVPFKPTGEKPVYCRDCFNKRNDRGGDARSFSRPEPRQDDNQDGGDGEEPMAA